MQTSPSTKQFAIQTFDPMAPRKQRCDKCETERAVFFCSGCNQNLCKECLREDH